MTWCLGVSVSQKKMDLISLITISIALSMDAFSVSICQGLSTKRFSLKMALSCGLWFGFFQALMPLIGYFLGAQFEHFITHIDHWIAFGLLSVIGVNMIREAAGESTRQRDNETTSEESPSHRVTESPSRDVAYYTCKNERDVVGASKYPLRFSVSQILRFSISQKQILFLNNIQVLLSKSVSYFFRLFRYHGRR